MIYATCFSVREMAIVSLPILQLEKMQGALFMAYAFQWSVSSVTSLNCALIKLSTYRLYNDFHKRRKRTAVLEVQLIVKNLSIIGLLSLPQLLI